MKRKADEEIPRSLAEAVSSLLALTTLDFDSFAPRSMAEKLAHQIIRSALDGDSESLTLVTRIALAQKEKLNQKPATISVIEE